MRVLATALILALAGTCFSVSKTDTFDSEFVFDDDLYIDPEKRWYLEIKPGYCYFSDQDMRQFFGSGGFAIRGETGYKFCGPLIVWLDAGYFQTDGQAIGGNEKIDFKLGSLTLGLKGIYYFRDCLAVYAGAGPRLFMMILHNFSPDVRGEDNEIGFGGGFNGGVWWYPIPRCPNLFLDFFADYSLKTMKVEEDEISSIDNDVDVSSLMGGIGIGVRF